MQAIIGRSNILTRAAHHMGIRKPYGTGHPGSKKKLSRREVHRTGFLKQRFDPIPLPYESFTDEDTEQFLNEDNYRYLSDCVHHYASLLGEDMEEPGGNVRQKIFHLYHRFLNILPDKHNLNIEIAEGRLVWVIWYVHRWFDNTFFMMPVKFVTEFTGRMRQIAMSFMHLFIRKNCLDRFSEGIEYEYMFESLADSMDSKYLSDEEKTEMEDQLDSYYNGEAGSLLDAIYKYKPLDVIRAIDEYIPANPREKEILCGFREGIRFISGECIMAYDYDPDADNFSGMYEDYPPLSLNRTIRYVYGLNDFVSNEITDYLNSELQETYAVYPVSCLVVTPESELFVPDDYPEQFCEWFVSMVGLLEDKEDEPGNT